MNSIRLIATLLLVLSLGLVDDLRAAETIRIGYTNAQGAKIPVFIAKEQRIFDKYGLDVRLMRVSPGRLAVPKLVAGEIHFFLGNSQPIVEAIATGKKPLAIIASLGKERFAIYTKPSITTVEDLKGKRFGVSTPGASQDRIAARALKKLGLDPQKDVRIVATRLNTSFERLQSLTRGEIDAVSATAEDILQLGQTESAKVRKLIELSELDITVSAADIAAARAYLSAQRGTVRRFLQALEEALDVARRRPDVVAAAYEKYAGVSDSRALDLKVKDYYAGNPPERPYPDKRAVLSALEELKEAHPDLEAEDISLFVDESLYL